MIHCDGLVKIYKTDDLEVVALQGLDLHVEAGELMAIIGNSGSGNGCCGPDRARGCRYRTEYSSGSVPSW